MSKNPLIDVKNKINIALAELGCKIPVIIEEDELIVRDIVVFVEKDEMIAIEASKPEVPLLRMPVNAATDIAASVAIHICKGVIIRVLTKNSLSGSI